MSVDETHDPALESWVESANSPDTDFPIQNLPFCVFRRGEEPPRVGVRIGDQILEVTGLSSLNALMARGRTACSELRLILSRALRAGNPDPPRHLAHPVSECELMLPVEIGDFTDFFSSIFHATNTGGIFRPGNPLPPNYKYVPIAYHGRASSIVVSGTPIRRPRGQWRDGTASPVFEPSRQVDYECEVGCFIGHSNALGHPVPIAEAGDQLFGLCLLNDWSARDIQWWEAQPLGPFLAKNFATTISPWVVTLDALEPFRVPRFERPPGDPQPLPYLDCQSDRERGGIALTVEVWISTQRMREQNVAPVRVSRAGFENTYWTLAQMVTHHTSNGCNLRLGDLLGSGTVSGPGNDGPGCLLELTREHPLALPSGESRKFLEDGDEVILRAYAEREGARRIGFGECRGMLIT
jgi:fumarylacetoacetase